MRFGSLRPALVALAAAACAGLAAATTVTGGLTVDARPALLAAGAALLAAAIGPRLRRPVAVAGILAGGAVAVAAVFGPAAMAHGGAPALLHTALTGLARTDAWAFSTGLGTVMWLAGSWTGWWAGRERRPWLALVPVYALVLLVPFAAGDPGAGAVEGGAAIVMSLLLVAAVRLGAVRPGGPPVAAGGALPVRAQATWTAAVTGVAVALVALAPPLTQHVLLRAGAEGGIGALQPRRLPIGFSTATVPGAGLTANSTPVLHYATADGEPVMLRLATQPEFAEGNWFPAIDQVAERPDGQISPARAPGGTPPPADTRSVRLHVVFDGGMHQDDQRTGGLPRVPFAGEPEAVSMPAYVFGTVAAGEPPAVRDPGGFQPLAHGSPGLATVDDVVVNGWPHSVDTVSGVPMATAQELRQAGTDYPASVLPMATIVPRTAVDVHELDVLRAIAQRWTRGTEDPYDAAMAIELHLLDQGTFHYTLTPPAPHGGDWPIVQFLTRTHQGYCQYFAASMGALLRTMSIPTRLVSGYGPGHPDGHGGYRVTSADAHVWVEAYVPQYGWIPFDPTPPASSGRPAPAAPANGPLDVLVTAAGHAPGVAATGAAVLGGAVLLAAVLVALVLLVPPRTPLGAWRRVVLAARLGGARRRPGETDLEMARRLTVGAAPPLAGAVDTVVSGALQQRFAPRGVASSEHDGWRAAWPAIRRSLPRLVGAGRRAR